MKNKNVLKIIFALSLPIFAPKIASANISHEIGEQQEELRDLNQELKQEKRSVRRNCNGPKNGELCGDSRSRMRELRSEINELKAEIKELKRERKTARRHHIQRDPNMYAAGNTYGSNGGNMMNSLTQLAQVFAMYQLGNQTVQSNAALGWPTNLNGLGMMGYGGMSGLGMMGGYGGLGNNGLGYGSLGYSGGLGYGGLGGTTSFGGIPLYSNTSSLFTNNSLSNYYLGSGSTGGIPLNTGSYLPSNYSFPSYYPSIR